MAVKFRSLIPSAVTKSIPCWPTSARLSEQPEKSSECTQLSSIEPRTLFKPCLSRFIRAYVTEIHQRSATIIQNQGKQQQGVGTAQPIGGAGYDHVQNSLNEVKEGLNMIKRDISVTAQRLASQPACPTSQPCLTTTIFAVFMVIQMIVMIAYFVYR